MSTQKPRKSEVTYWMRIEEYPGVNPCMFVVDANGKVTMFIIDFSRLVLEYDYDVPQNTTHHALGCIQMSEAAFKKRVKAIQAKYGVKFSIKTEWGTNDIHSS